VPPPVTPPPPTGGANQAPVANAGVSRTVVTGSLVNLSGTASTDPENAALSYAWTLQAPAGSTASLTSTTAAQPSFTADVAGSYTVTLIVNDGALNSAPAVITITAQTAAPALDGVALYASNCQGCHGPIAPIFNRNARTASGIQSAIDANRGGMGSLRTLTPAEVQAIAAAVAAANP